jgi:hypothetical protein
MLATLQFRTVVSPSVFDYAETRKIKQYRQFFCMAAKRGLLLFGGTRTADVGNKMLMATSVSWRD